MRGKKWSPSKAPRVHSGTNEFFIRRLSEAPARETLRDLKRRLKCSSLLHPLPPPSVPPVSVYSIVELFPITHQCARAKGKDQGVSGCYSLLPPTILRVIFFLPLFSPDFLAYFYCRCCKLSHIHPILLFHFAFVVAISTFFFFAFRLLAYIHAFLFFTDWLLILQAVAIY